MPISRETVKGLFNEFGFMMAVEGCIAVAEVQTMPLRVVVWGTRKIARPDQLTMARATLERKKHPINMGSYITQAVIGERNLCDWKIEKKDARHEYRKSIRTAWKKLF